MNCKKFVKKFIPKMALYKANIVLSQNKGKELSKKGKLIYLAKNYFKYKLFSNVDESINLINMYKKMDLKIKDTNSFIYFIDEYKIFYQKNNYSNGTVSYSVILENSLDELVAKTTNEQMKKEYMALEKIIDLILEANTNVESKYLNYIKNIKSSKPTNLEEALQRILFLNSVLWQTRHTLMGLGRMDIYLNNFIADMSEDEIIKTIKPFLTTLHNDYKFKSGNLFGDTGQIIICGGLNEDGTYFSNKLTYCFIKALKELQIPDPKVLLRVSNNMPDELLKLALECIKTGIGCPLLSNDERVIPAMIEFGYDTFDAYNYVTSACWEPFPQDVSAELNNFASLNFLKLFTNMLNSANLDTIISVEDILSNYYSCLNEEVALLNKKANDFVFGDELLASCFNYACVNSQKLIKDFGAKYNNFGVTGLGLSSVVDSIIAIDYIVFKEKQKSLTEYMEVVKNDFKNQDRLKTYIKDELPKYGNDSEYVIGITNKIISKTREFFVNNCKDTRKLKFGLSSPDYISATKDIPATPDGRCFGNPVNVHISCEKFVACTEIVSFASSLDYSKVAFNGNVIDYILTPSFLEDNFDKFLNFLKVAIKKGFFQMQFNVVSSELLIKAKNNPENYKNLIVRVWGFSAYFNELPEEYKNYLIERAKKSENAHQ